MEFNHGSFQWERFKPDKVRAPNTDPYCTPWSRLLREDLLLSAHNYVLLTRSKVRPEPSQSIPFNTLLRISHFAPDLLKQSQLTGMSFWRIAKPHEDHVFAHAHAE